jgi:cytochrome b561
MVSTYSPLTPEGQIEGTGRFAEGLKRIITNWQRRRSLVTPRPRQWMTVAGLFGSIALAALLTGISIVGRDAYQSPPPWAWFALAALFGIAAASAGRRAVLDRRRVRAKSL